MRHYSAYYKSKLGYEYILDTVPGASLALSLRKLRSAYAGYCIRIRRSSDNAELDIGFVNNVVDIATILTFIGAGSGYIVTWYDQSGNANNAGQGSATAQPLFVVDGGEDIKYKPVIELDGVNDYISFSEITDIRTCYIVTKHRTGVQDFAPILGHSSAYYFHGGASTSLFDTSYTSGNILYGDGAHLYIHCYVNGISAYGTQLLKPSQHKLISIVTYGNVSALNISNDRNNPGRFWDGDYAEIILYNSPHNYSIRQQVENNQITNYGL